MSGELSFPGPVLKWAFFDNTVAIGISPEDSTFGATGAD
jgi:hypothetical protein